MLVAPAIAHICPALQPDSVDSRIRTAHDLQLLARSQCNLRGDRPSAAISILIHHICQIHLKLLPVPFNKMHRQADQPIHRWLHHLTFHQKPCIEDRIRPHAEIHGTDHRQKWIKHYLDTGVRRYLHIKVSLELRCPFLQKSSYLLPQEPMGPVHRRYRQSLQAGLENVFHP